MRSFKSFSISGFIILMSLLLVSCGGGGGGGGDGGNNGDGGGENPPPNLAPDINYMRHSSGTAPVLPVTAVRNEYHAYFEDPGMPTVTITDTTDLTQLATMDYLYISETSINGLNMADMTLVSDWTTNGGILVINRLDEGDVANAFGTFLGAGFEFTSSADPAGDTSVVTDSTHKLVTFPNVLDDVALSNWGTAVHGAFSVVGAAYTCVVDDTDGASPLPALCTASLGSGAIIITGFNPDCDCHDDHLAAGTSAGSELMENFIMYLQ